MDKIRLIYHSNEGLDPKYQLSLQETLSFKATLDSSHLNSLQSIMAQTTALANKYCLLIIFKQIQGI